MALNTSARSSINEIDFHYLLAYLHIHMYICNFFYYKILYVRLIEIQFSFYTKLYFLYKLCFLTRNFLGFSIYLPVTYSKGDSENRRISPFLR